MRMNYKGESFTIGPFTNQSFIDDTFKIDTLMSPIINKLIEKGYETRACCQGHVGTHWVCNYDECCDNTKAQYESERNGIIDTPYIMFEDNIPIPTDVDLPYGWKMSVYTPRSANINTDEDAKKMKEYVAVTTPTTVKQFMNEGGFNYHISIDRDYLHLNDDDIWDKVNDDPYDAFYLEVTRLHHELYKWVCNLPIAAYMKNKE